MVAGNWMPEYVSFCRAVGNLLIELQQWKRAKHPRCLVLWRKGRNYRVVYVGYVGKWAEAGGR